MIRLSALLLLSTLLGAADLSVVKTEPNLEKRSEKALVYANDVLAAMRAELDKNNVDKIKDHLRELEATVDLSIDSLKATGKNARRNPKYFKRAELRLRELQRRLETFRRDMSFDDRPVLDGVIAHIAKRIDELVEATLRG